MKSYASEPSIAQKGAKAASLRLGNDQDQAGTGFEALMAGLVPAQQPQPIARVQAAPEAANTNAEPVSSAPAQTRSEKPSNKPAPASEDAGQPNDASKHGAPTNAQNGNGSAQPNATSDASAQTPAHSTARATGQAQLDLTAQAATIEANQLAAGQTNEGQANAADANAVLTSLAALGTDAEVTAPVPTGFNGQKTTTDGQPLATSAPATANQATPNPNAARANVGNLIADDATTPAAPSNGAATASAVHANTSAIAAKPKAAEPALDIKSLGKTAEPTPSFGDLVSSQSASTGQEATFATGEPTSRPQFLTPNTVPMLAATMMRRLESGAKQFSMRLDPPELGQVEVKLTVDADKKVRAVISADRPEALADLVRSARELARALTEAGLDLEDNGLTFNLNDPSSNQQQSREGRSSHGGQFDVSARQVSETLIEEAPIALEEKTNRNDPFQAWQRARIAISA